MNADRDRKTLNAMRLLLAPVQSSLLENTTLINSQLNQLSLQLNNTTSYLNQRIDTSDQLTYQVQSALNSEKDEAYPNSLKSEIVKKDQTKAASNDFVIDTTISPNSVWVGLNYTYRVNQTLVFNHSPTEYFYAQVKDYDPTVGDLIFGITKLYGTPGTYTGWDISVGSELISDRYGSTTNTICEGNDPRLTNARTPTAHTHRLSDLTQSSAATDQVPAWNGSNWVPVTPVKLGVAQTFTAKQTFGELEATTEVKTPKVSLSSVVLNTSVSGVLEYDGKVIHGNAASGRGVIPVMQISSVNTTKSLNSATGDQNIFDVPQDVITLAANTTYIIRGYLILNTGTTTARNLFLRFIEGVSANPPTIHFATVGMPSTGGAASRAQDTAFFNTTNGGQITQTTFITNNYSAWITGVIKTVDSVTITPKIAFSAAPGNTNTVGFGTYIAFIPVGSNPLTAIGPWS